MTLSPKVHARLERLNRCAHAVQRSRESERCKSEVNIQVAIYSALILGCEKHPEDAAALETPLGQVDAFCNLVETTFPEQVI